MGGWNQAKAGRWTRWLVPVALLLAAGCSSDSSSGPGGGSGGTSGSGGLRCGDLLTTADVEAMGLDTTSYDENASQSSPSLGVLCHMKPILATFFHGEEYDTVVAGGEDAVSKNMLMADTGPSVGAKDTWFSISGIAEVVFLTNSGKYAASITGADKNLVGTTAASIDAKIESK